MNILVWWRYKIFWRQ